MSDAETENWSKKVEFSNYAPFKGKLDFKLILKSDSYIGTDFEKVVTLNIESKIEEKEKFKINDEDEKALNEESMFT